jgi:alkylation response protein AidB-like acyl-CoA dehydrogenase
VDFELTDEQRLFQQTLRDFADKEIVPVAQELERTGTYPTKILAGLKELGLFGLNVPEEYGGLGADRIAYSLAFEEIGRAWLGAAGLFGIHSVACWLIARNGTDEQKERYLPRMATGELRSGLGLTEPGAGTDLQGIVTTAVRDGDHYVVNGTKTWITNARVAGMLPMLVKTDKSVQKPQDGMSVLLVDTDSPGFTVSKDLPKLGYKGPETCELVLDNVRVPVANLLGGVEGRGLQQVLNGLEIGRINVASRAVGVAQAAYDAALRYSRERHAFGQPISGFQAIQLKLADMATEIQAARLLTRWAAARSQAGGRVDMEAGMAKLYASEVALKCSLESMRIHGAYGYSGEFIVERLYRDAPLMAIGEGTNDVQRLVIARALVSGAGHVGG